MQRRQFVAFVALGALAPLARAHHGWSSFDQSAPIYLRGNLKTVRWANPHVEAMLEVAANLSIPADLAGRALPAQAAPVDGKAILGKAAVPRRKDRVWEIEFAPLSRMEAWKIERLKPGEPIEVVGFTFPGEKGEATLRVEFLFRGARAYALRSSPA